MGDFHEIERSRRASMMQSVKISYAHISNIQFNVSKSSNEIEVQRN